MDFKRLLCVITLGLGLHTAVLADTIALHPNAPERYVVVKGDTLWDIAGRFLQDPWLWPEIWQVNPEIANPHLIYPGDVIVLTYDEQGRPILTVERGRPGVKLSPQARSSQIEEAIPSIPLDAIQQFLSAAQIVDRDDYEKAPYVVSFQDNRIIAGMGDTAYVRGDLTEDQRLYSISRLGRPYKDPVNGEVLGYEAIDIGEATFERPGDPKTFNITASTREVLIGDRLFPIETTTRMANYIPHPVQNDKEGVIIAVLDGVSRIGQFQVVAVNLGLDDGIEPGHVFAVYQSGREVLDTVAGGTQKITLPDEHAGVLMVFRPFKRISYALVMRATRDMRIKDAVRAP